MLSIRSLVPNFGARTLTLSDPCFGFVSKVTRHGLSPDAFVQMAFQAAYYSLYGAFLLNAQDWLQERPELRSSRLQDASRAPTSPR